MLSMLPLAAAAGYAADTVFIRVYLLRFLRRFDAFFRDAMFSLFSHATFSLHAYH